MKEHWKRLPPGYRQLGEGMKVRIGDLKWLSDVKLWQRVLPSETDVGRQQEGSFYATPDKVEGAPPLYRRVGKKTVWIKPGMLAWANGEWRPFAESKGRLTVSDLILIEPAPPYGFEWIEPDETLVATDGAFQQDETRSERRPVLKHQIGATVSANDAYKFVRLSARIAKQEQEQTAVQARNARREEWGSF